MEVLDDTRGNKPPRKKREPRPLTEAQLKQFQEWFEIPGPDEYVFVGPTSSDPEDPS